MKNAKKPVVKIDAYKFAEWLCDDTYVTADYVDMMVNGCRPMKELITCTDEWQKDCCKPIDLIENIDELGPYLNYDEDGDIDDEDTFNTNLKIRWM